jgi:RNA polymerase sigma factor (sigma-70 family)
MIDELTSDDELLAAWSTGSKRAGDMLIERHFSLVHRFFRNKIGAEVDDLVQQTFLGCIEARERYRAESSFKTFLLGIARNQLFRYYRGRHEQVDFAVTSIRDLGTSPSGTVSKRQDERLLMEALQLVPLDAQVILELAYWEGLAGVDLARVLNVSVNTVHTRLHRARRSLRAKLETLTSDAHTLWRTQRLVESIGGPSAGADEEDASV